VKERASRDIDPVDSRIRIDPSVDGWHPRPMASNQLIRIAARRRAAGTRQWTRAEYDRLIDLGILDEDEPIELLGGEMVVREPQAGPHATSVQLVHQALQRVFRKGWTVRQQLPIALDLESEPEPDVCVVPGRPRDYRSSHPTDPVLVIEVAHDSLLRDRERKGSLYARAGIADYWIVNLREAVLEVYREPARSPRSPYGWRYGRIERFGREAVISPLAAPRARVRVKSLLP
jgi:Uma2 family endonuclease